VEHAYALKKELELTIAVSPSSQEAEYVSRLLKRFFSADDDRSFYGLRVQRARAIGELKSNMINCYLDKTSTT